MNDYSLLMHGIAGLVAWELTRQRPQAIDNLIILNAIVHDKDFNQPNVKSGMVARQMSKAFSNKFVSVAVLEVIFNNLRLRGDKSYLKKNALAM